MVIQISREELQLIRQCLAAQHRQDSAWLVWRHTTPEERQEFLDRRDRIDTLLAKLQGL